MLNVVFSLYFKGIVASRDTFPKRDKIIMDRYTHYIHTPRVFSKTVNGYTIYLTGRSTEVDHEREVLFLATGKAAENHQCGVSRILTKFLQEQSHERDRGGGGYQQIAAFSLLSE